MNKTANNRRRSAFGRAFARLQSRGDSRAYSHIEILRDMARKYFSNSEARLIETWAPACAIPRRFARDARDARI